jgi:hypothetical protein
LGQVCTFLEEQGALHQWNPITKGFDLNNESDAEGKKINPGNSTEVSQIFKDCSFCFDKC